MIEIPLPRPAFVHALTEVITDAHFSARNRLARTLEFMARILQDGKAKRIRDITIDERTAVLLDPDGVGTVAGAGSAYFCRPPKNPDVCKANTALTFRGFRCIACAPMSIST